MKLSKNRCLTVSARNTLAVAICAISSSVYAASQDIEVVEVYGKEQGDLGLNSGNSAANRLGLTAMEIPASVEILSHDEIQARGDYSASSALTRSTGFSSSATPGNGGTSSAVRGFNGHSSVSYTYDGTRLYVGAGTVTFPADTWTIERVEVLRGAGSVINGVGAIGATVNYQPKAPDFEEIRSEIDVTLGTDALRRIAFGSGGKINDNLAYRFDAVNHDSDGYVDNGDESRRALAGSLLYRVNEDLDLKFSIDYAETDQSAYWGTPLVDGEILSATRDKNYNIDDGIVEYEDLWPRLRVSWNINESTKLRSDTFYLKADRHWRNVESYDFNSVSGDVDRSFYLEIMHDQEQWGNRSDILFDIPVAGMSSHLSVGAEFNIIEFTHTNNRPYTGSSSVDLLNPVGGSWSAGVQTATSEDFVSDTSQYAVFVDYQIELTEQVSLVAGIRRDEIDVDREDFARSNGPGHSEDAENTDIDFSGTSWRLGAVYRPSETISIYAQASAAQDSIQSILSATDPDQDLGEGRQYEIGLKQILWDGRLQYAVALYDIEKDNLKSQNPGGVIEQIGQQSSRGMELDISLAALENLTIDFNVALTDPEFDEYVSRGTDLSGKQPRNVPEQTANLWVYWQATEAIQVNAGARYVGERYANDANTVELPNYTIWDVGAKWQVNEALSFSLHGKNLSDEDDYILAPYGNQWILGPDRSVELGLNYRF